MTDTGPEGVLPPLTSTRRRIARPRTIFLVFLGIVAAIDVSHAILNAIYRPYEGTIDKAMHIVLSVAPLGYLAALFFVASALVTWFQHRRWTIPAAVVILVILLELAFTLSSSPRSGSSSYTPLFPDFAAGLIIGGLTVAGAKRCLAVPFVRFFLTGVLVLWFIAPLLVDLLWYSERTSRGTGPLWQLPVLGYVLGAFAYFLLLSGNPSFLIPFQWPHPELLPIGGWIITGGAVGWFLWRIDRNWQMALAVALSLWLFGHKLMEWASFVAD